MYKNILMATLVALAFAYALMAAFSLGFFYGAAATATYLLEEYEDERDSNSGNSSLDSLSILCDIDDGVTICPTYDCWENVS